MESPDSHGSRRIEKRFAVVAYPEELRASSFGEKVRRKVASPLRCLTDNDILMLLRMDMVECAHGDLIRHLQRRSKQLSSARQQKKQLQCVEVVDEKRRRLRTAVQSGRQMVVDKLRHRVSFETQEMT